MKVFLSGYGKMGRMLEELALERGWEVVGHADITCPEAYETPRRGRLPRFSGVGALTPAQLPAPHEDRPCQRHTG
ncbi:MAG: hypothetical protein ACLTGM_12175 [Oscillospiraceae bacterium]